MREITSYPQILNINLSPRLAMTVQSMLKTSEKSIALIHLSNRDAGEEEKNNNEIFIRKAKFTSTQFGHNSNIHRKTNYNDGGNKDFDHYLPTHMENFYIHRQKQYAAYSY